MENFFLLHKVKKYFLTSREDNWIGNRASELRSVLKLTYSMPATFVGSQLRIKYPDRLINEHEQF